MKRMKPQITDKNIEQFQKILIKSEKSKNTIQKYIRDVRKFQIYSIGKKITKELVLSYKADLEQQGHYQIHSINSYLVALNRFFQCMGWSELCVKTIKVQRTAFESAEKEITMDEYAKLVRAAVCMGDESTAMIVQTIASTGIRISELSYIRVETLQTGMADVHNKGKVRRILLPSTLTKLLQNYAKAQHITSGAIFRNRKGNSVDRKTIWRHMKKAAAYAGIPAAKVFPHNLRHLFAKEFYRQTGDIMKLADILGHSNINTTRIYIRTAGGEHKKQLDAMGMVLTEKKSVNEQETHNSFTREKVTAQPFVQSEYSKSILTDGGIWLPMSYHSLDRSLVSSSRQLLAGSSLVENSWQGSRFRKVTYEVTVRIT